MARRKADPDDEKVRYRSIQLTATVMERSDSSWEMNTEEALDFFRVVDARALRKWHKQGMPFRRIDRREVRYGADAVLWWSVRKYLEATGKWRGNTYLDMDRAYRIEMYLQSTDPIYREPMVLVPLSHDHPLRERMLQMACHGRPGASLGATRELSDADLDVWEPEAPLDAK